MKILTTALKRVEQTKYLNLTVFKLQLLKIIVACNSYSTCASNSISTSVAPPKSLREVPVFDVGS